MNDVSKLRNYSTGCTKGAKPNVTQKLENLYVRSKENPDRWIDRNLYKILADVEILELAYKKLRSNPGQMTPGITPETLDGLSRETLENIVGKLKDESFRFSPGRRVEIPKPSGGSRSLTVAPPRDKLVQEAIRMILEPVFEPTFSEHSHGFRTKRSCHTALKAVRTQFQTAN